MHEAYDVHNLLKLAVQIESIAAYDEQLLVGTRQGHLLMYSVVPRATDQKYDIQLMRYCKTFSKKPIEQLDVNLDYNILVSLTDNFVSVHDINSLNFPMICQLPKTKGAALFTLNTERQVSMTEQVSVLLRLCVAVKRKLQLYYWKNNEFHTLADITLNDVPRALSWCEETICVGFKGEYILYELNGKSQELFPTGSSRSSEPSITKISEKMFALGRENQTVLVNTKGEAEKTKAVRWSEVVVSLAWDKPYMLGLLNDIVEIQTLENGGVVQTLKDLHKARLLCYCRQGLLYVASATHLWCLQAVDVTKQRQQLLNNKQFELAVELTNISSETEEEKKEKIHQIQTLHAYDLFANKQFKKSMEEFLKLETDPYDVIRLFPDLLPQTNTEQNPDTSESVPKLQDRDLENGMLALIAYLTEVRTKTRNQSKANINASGNLNDKSVMSKATSQLLQIIDTTLLKCYLQTNDALIAPLLRRNHCHLGEAEKTLKKHHKYLELIILYNTKGQHRKALELLQKQSDQMDSSLKGYEESIKYLQHLGAEHINLIFEFAGWILDARPEEGLKIFTEDILEVEHLPRPKVLDYLLRTHKSLVIPYLEHVVHTLEDSNVLFSNVLIHQYKEKIENDKDQPSAQTVRSKLLTFLEKSTTYAPDTAINNFLGDSFIEEHALILGKMDRHKEVLLIYVGILENIDRAVDYCNKVQTRDENGNTFVLLIKMLLNPPTKNDFKDIGLSIDAVKPTFQSEKKIDKALELLNKYADKINPIDVLDVLPDDVSISQIKHFLEISFQKVLNDRRRGEILNNFLLAESDRIEELRILHENQSILITDLNVCPVCKKRFGNQSAFVRYPNGDVVHFSCQDKRF